MSTNTTPTPSQPGARASTPASFAIRYTALALLLFALTLWRYHGIFYVGDVFPDSPEAVRLALNLYHHGEFANLFFAADTGPTVHLAPGFPLYVTLLLHIFGTGLLGAQALVVSCIVAAGILVAALPLASRLLGLGWGAGTIAAGLWLFAQPALYPRWESTYAGLLTLAAALLMRRFMERPGVGSGLALGCVAGITLLVSPPVLLVFVAWLIWLVCRGSKHLVLVAGVVVVVIAPWIVRNYIVFGRLVPLRGNFGLELAISNNDCAQFAWGLNRKSGCFEKQHPNMSEPEAAMVRRMGEIQYNRMRLEEAAHWISGHPRTFARLIIERIGAFWFPHETPNMIQEFLGPGRRAERWSIYLSTLLSLVGILICLRRNRKTAWILVSLLLMFPLIYYVIQYEDRYRMPILWVTFLLAGIAIRQGLSWAGGMVLGRGSSLSSASSTAQRTALMEFLPPRIRSDMLRRLSVLRPARAALNARPLPPGAAGPLPVAD